MVQVRTYADIAAEKAAEQEKAKLHNKVVRALNHMSTYSEALAIIHTAHRDTLRGLHSTLEGLINEDACIMSDRAYNSRVKDAMKAVSRRFVLLP